MRTQEVIERCGIAPKLIRGVIRQLGGTESFKDIRNHGVDGGFPGFTYTADCVEFFKRHRTEIVELVIQMADDLGETPAEMVAGFNCLVGHRRGQDERELRKAVAEYLPSVYRCLGGGKLTDEDDQVANALAWFAAEEVARAFEDQ